MTKSIGVRLGAALTPLHASALIPLTFPVCLRYSNQDSKTKTLNPNDLSPGPPNKQQNEISKIGFPMTMPCALWSRTLRSGSPRRHSDLDLVVEVLPAAAQLEAMGLGGGCIGSIPSPRRSGGHRYRPGPLGRSAVPLARKPAAAIHCAQLKPWRAWPELRGVLNGLQGRLTSPRA